MGPQRDLPVSKERSPPPTPRCFSKALGGKDRKEASTVVSRAFIQEGTERRGLFDRHCAGGWFVTVFSKVSRRKGAEGRRTLWGVVSSRRKALGVGREPLASPQTGGLGSLHMGEV